MKGIPVTSEKVAVSAAAVGLTSTSYLIGNQERGAVIEVLDNDIFYTLDVTTGTPTSADHIGQTGKIIETLRPSRFRAVRQTADANLKVTYHEL